MVKNTNWLYLLIISSLGLYALYLHDEERQWSGLQRQLFLHWTVMSEISEKQAEYKAMEVEKNYRDWPSDLHRSLHEGTEAAHETCLSYQTYMENHLNKKYIHHYRKPSRISGVLGNDAERRDFWQKYQSSMDTMRQIVQKDTFLYRIYADKWHTNPELMYAENDSLKAIWMKAMGLKFYFLAHTIANRFNKRIIEHTLHEKNFDQIMPMIALRSSNIYQTGHWIEGDVYIRNYHRGEPNMLFKQNDIDIGVNNGIAMWRQKFSKAGKKQFDLKCYCYIDYEVERAILPFPYDRKEYKIEITQ